MHSTTTFARIVELYHAAGALLAKDDIWTTAERARYDDIQAEIDQLWPRRRQELVLQVAGPPQLLSAPDPRSQRQVARGIAPLPALSALPALSGGD